MLHYDDYLRLVKRSSPRCFIISKGFVPNMLVDAKIYVDDSLLDQLFAELRTYIESNQSSFIPALIQLANVASLPGIVGHSIGLPDIHAGYGFAIGIRLK